jgi:formyl-CoA transferase
VSVFLTGNPVCIPLYSGGQPGWVLKCKGWEPITRALGRPEWATDPAYMTAQARQDKTKYEAVDILRKSGSIVEVDHKVRGKYLTIGSPIQFSDLKVEVKPSPVLGEHTDEVLADLGYDKAAIAGLHAARAV